jgi:hypothetical protein
LVGEDKENTIISNNNYSGQSYPGGKDAFGRNQYSTYTSYTPLITEQLNRLPLLTGQMQKPKRDLLLNGEFESTILFGSRLLILLFVLMPLIPQESVQNGLKIVFIS